MAANRVVIPTCPSCKTRSYVVPLRFCERAGTAVGGMAGILLTCMMEKGESAPDTICRALSKSTADEGRLALSAFLAGLTTGNKIGSLIDEHILGLYRCNQCGHWFSG